MLRSKRDDWRTPQNIVDVVYEALGDVELDPCGNRHSLVGARKQYLLSKGEDGLVLPWRGRVFVNPPFSSGAAWLDKAATCWAAGGDFECIMLMPARVDTKAFHRSGTTADAICFWKGRLTFVGAPASAPFPTMFMYWGDRPGLFAEVFSKHGHVMVTSRSRPRKKGLI
jgi:hypothetical protein